MAIETVQQLSQEAEAAMSEMTSNDGVYWTRGHHDKTAFSEAVNWYDGDDQPDPGAVRHQYWRAKRITEDDICMFGADPDWGWVYIPTRKGRGAFAVTVWDRRDGTR